MSDDTGKKSPGGGEWASFKTPAPKDVAPVPQVGANAPSSPRLQLPNGRPTIIVFLRHCGCPFAEKTFKRMTALAAEHQSVKFIAISHSSQEATERWIPQVGGTWGIEVITDEERDLYSAWGLGVSSTWHALSPSVLWSVYRLGKDEGIWNRPTESGSRWQTSGAFAVSRFGSVAWSHVAASAADIPDLDEALQKLGVAPQKTPQ